MKVALVYDWANQQGGAERVAEMIASLFPKIELFTAVYHPQQALWSKSFSSVKTSFLNKFPGAKTKYYLYWPLFPLAFESFDFSSFDLVISLTSAFAKGVITGPETCHLCYCLTPPRFLWQPELLPLPWRRWFFLGVALREEDYFLSRRPDYYLAISRTVAARVRKFYRRKARVVYPGIDLKKFTPGGGERGDFFLWVGRLVEYKRVDLLIRVFNRLKKRLLIIGRGREERRLKRMAGDNIRFLGWVKEEQLVDYYRRCQALVCPQEEDFGLVSLEAQACGRPVIAFGKGGIKETVVAGKTGEFFFSEESLVKLIKNFNPERYHLNDCRRQAERFSQEKFKSNFIREVERCYQDFKNKRRKG